MDHAAPNVLPPHARDIADALVGVQRQREVEALARAERPAVLESLELGARPAMVRAKLVDIHRNRVAGAEAALHHTDVWPARSLKRRAPRRRVRAACQA